MRTLTFLLFLVFISGNAQKGLDGLLAQYNTRSIPYISVEETRMLHLKGKSIIMDAREKREYDVSHIPTALFVGFNTFSAENISEKIKDKNTPIIIYCSLGIRSEQIGEKLKKEGFTNVRNVYGGIFEWKNKGYPVVDSLENDTENVHAFSRIWGKWLQKGNRIYE